MVVYVFNARKNQLASVFLSNIAELVLCAQNDWMPLLPALQNFDTTDRSTEEAKDHPLCLVLGEIVTRIDDGCDVDFEVYKKRSAAALVAIYSCRQDVASSLQQHFLPAILTKLSDSSTTNVFHGWSAVANGD